MKNIYTAIAALLCGADSLIKYAIERNHPDGELRPALHGKIIIRKFHNKGAMLNLGASRQQTMAVLSVIFTVFMTGICGDFGNQRQAYAQDRIVIDTGRSLQ